MSYFNINRVVLVGRLTRDPELRALPSGESVCSLRVACNGARRSAEGEYQERPNFFDVTVYRAAGENVSRYVRRGSRLAVDGRLEWREWETADQQKRQAVSVVAETVQFLDSPGERSKLASGDGRDDDQERGDGELVGVGAETDQADLAF
jgi:single-strand DNA-binding protein